MSETHTVHDPFSNKEVEISSALVDRLRGKYAVGPTLENGEPEFGWREHPAPPIQHEAALEITRLREEAKRLRHALDKSVEFQSHYANILNMTDGGKRLQFRNGEEWIDRLRTTR